MSPKVFQQALLTPEEIEAATDRSHLADITYQKQHAQRDQYLRDDKFRSVKQNIVEVRQSVTYRCFDDTPLGRRLLLKRKSR